ncbi:hypothetical protein RBY4I_3674 [Rhodobacterales bacterium Y4I]|nr:hypothetical protein RBY4I_3674 [Rhodobacterales bacterium Y4I]
MRPRLRGRFHFALLDAIHEKIDKLIPDGISGCRRQCPDVDIH